jgi:hypothetical protein
LLCEARARFDGIEREVYTRVGGAGGRIYVDLANDRWQAIEIGTTGWRVLDSKLVPVRFRRAPGMLPLPLPLTGGTIDDLRAFLNVKSDDDFELAVAWLLAAMRDRGPYPVLALMGEQGSAKTSFATILRSLVDPNTAALRSFPREDRDLFIAASNGWVVGYDNVSRVPSWLSDAMCRLATGGGFSTRKLYTDDEEQLFNAQRPLLLNGIEDFVNRPDLADRTIFLTLDPIPEERRKADQALQDEVDRARPLILGALLDRLLSGLQRMPSTRLARLPRMADFALWATACEASSGAFMRAYENNRASAVEVVLEADLVATAVRTLMRTRDGEGWAGTSTSLLKALNEVVDENQRRGRDWPGSPRALSGRLRRAATNLRKIGIEVAIVREGHDRARTIHITMISGPKPDKDGNFASAWSASSAESRKSNGGNGFRADGSADGRGENADGADGRGDVQAAPDHADGGADDGPHDRPHTVRTNPLKTKAADGAGGAGDVLRTQSCKADDEPACQRCGIPGNATDGQLILAGRDGAAGHYHPRCWTEERTKGPLRKPPLGPLGDSLEDLK